MMYQAAISLGVELRVLAADSSDAAARIARHVTVGDWHDVGVLREFAAACDVVTFDHELVDAATVESLENEGIIVRPGSQALGQAADKACQRSLCDQLGIATPPYVIVSDASGVAAAATQLGYPMMAKLARGGYDGRGVFRLSDDAAARELFDRLPPDTVVVIEPELQLIAELATQVVRRADGTMVGYPVVRTYQEDGICRMLEAPAEVEPAVARQARDWAAALAEAVEAVGVLAVEFFLTDQGLVVNELAPRPHNSGHYSIEACVTSQFENHLRAVLDLPLGAPDLAVPAAVMVNLIAGRTPPSDLEGLTADPHARVHWYGKTSRPGRKVGHVTTCGTDRSALLRRAAQLYTPGAAGESGPGTARTQPSSMEVGS
ncbi:MAG: 5-(carboxyamino)imidazole ribonucleotide synthase [Acidimicrobiales bacterium]